IGGVYHAYEGEIIYSLITSQDNPKIPRDIIESYELICNGIVHGLELLGVEAHFKPINDIEVDGRKISGNAQTRRWGRVLQHGTILVDADVRTMFTVLKVSKEKISDKMIKSAEERVTTIRRELGREVEFEEVAEALKRGFMEVLGVNLVEGRLSGGERALATKLRKSKYSTERWVFDRPKGFTL
ncbi:MAG: biotin/lipoate A/B protein ligase family protein, partial [Candidatus Bathyarchaeia archaeon]